MFWEWDQKDIISLAAGVGVFVSCWTVLLFLKRWCWKRLRAWAEKTPQAWDEVLIGALSRPVHVSIFFIALSVGLHAIPNKLLTIPSVVQGNKIIFILLFAWIVDRISSVFFRFSTLPGNLNEESRSLVVTIFRVLFLSITLLIILDTLGISITPLLASLGVGSIAVALALQDTLGNFFSGVYMVIDRPLSVGDFIRLDGGIEGYVRKIGWRSTRLELLSNNLVVIPNSKLSSAILTNFNLPVLECIVKIQLGVSYSSDLKKVEQILLDTGRGLQRTFSFAVHEHIPVVRYLNFGDSNISVEISLKAQTYVDTGLLKHEFIKALHERVQNNELELPFPQLVIHKAQQIQD